MKLWFVMYIFGKAAMVVGPLPYGMEECRNRLPDHVADMDEAFRKFPSALQPNGRRAVRRDVTFNCIEQEKRPVIDESYKAETKR